MRRVNALALTLIAATSAHADEGMWLVNDFPTDLVKKTYGSAPDAAAPAKRAETGCGPRPDDRHRSPPS